MAQQIRLESLKHNIAAKAINARNQQLLDSIYRSIPSNMYSVISDNNVPFHSEPDNNEHTLIGRFGQLRLALKKLGFTKDATDVNIKAFLASRAQHLYHKDLNSLTLILDYKKNESGAKISQLTSMAYTLEEEMHKANIPLLELQDIIQQLSNIAGQDITNANRGNIIRRMKEVAYKLQQLCLESEQIKNIATQHLNELQQTIDIEEGMENALNIITRNDSGITPGQLEDEYSITILIEQKINDTKDIYKAVGNLTGPEIEDVANTIKAIECQNQSDGNHGNPITMARAIDLVQKANAPIQKILQQQYQVIKDSGLKIDNHISSLASVDSRKSLTVDETESVKSINDGCFSVKYAKLKNALDIIKAAQQAQTIDSKVIEELEDAFTSIKKESQEDDDEDTDTEVPILLKTIEEAAKNCYGEGAHSVNIISALQKIKRDEVLARNTLELTDNIVIDSKDIKSFLGDDKKSKEITELAPNLHGNIYQSITVNRLQHAIYQNRSITNPRGLTAIEIPAIWSISSSKAGISNTLNDACDSSMIKKIIQRDNDIVLKTQRVTSEILLKHIQANMSQLSAITKTPTHSNNHRTLRLICQQVLKPRNGSKWMPRQLTKHEIQAINSLPGKDKLLKEFKSSIAISLQNSDDHQAKVKAASIAILDQLCQNPNFCEYVYNNHKKISNYIRNTISDSLCKGIHDQINIDEIYPSNKIEKFFGKNDLGKFIDTLCKQELKKITGKHDQLKDIEAKLNQIETDYPSDSDIQKGLMFIYFNSLKGKSLTNLDYSDDQKKRLKYVLSFILRRFDIFINAFDLKISASSDMAKAIQRNIENTIKELSTESYQTEELSDEWLTKALYGDSETRAALDVNQIISSTKLSNVLNKYKAKEFEAMIVRNFDAKSVALFIQKARVPAYTKKALKDIITHIEDISGKKAVDSSLQKFSSGEEGLKKFCKAVSQSNTKEITKKINKAYEDTFKDKHRTLGIHHTQIEHLIKDKVEINQKEILNSIKEKVNNVLLDINITELDQANPRKSIKINYKGEIDKILTSNNPIEDLMNADQLTIHNVSLTSQSDDEKINFDVQKFCNLLQTLSFALASKANFQGINGLEDSNKKKMIEALWKNQIDSAIYSSDSRSADFEKILKSELYHQEALELLKQGDIKKISDIIYENIIKDMVIGKFQSEAMDTILGNQKIKQAQHEKDYQEMRALQRDLETAKRVSMIKDAGVPANIEGTVDLLEGQGSKNGHQFRNSVNLYGSNRSQQPTKKRSRTRG